jgi:mRNA interferase MazF
MVARFDVFLVNLDPVVTADARNTRPGVIISPDELNNNLDTVIIAPLSSTNLRYPTRVPVTFLNSERYIVLDQIRTVDSSRLVKKVGEIDPSFRKAAIERLSELFAE